MSSLTGKCQVCESERNERGFCKCDESFDRQTPPNTALNGMDIGERMPCGHDLARLAYRCETCVTATLRTAAERVERVERLLHEATNVIASIGLHREMCHDYDEDVGQPKRDFFDDEEWDLVEQYARERAGYYRTALLAAAKGKNETKESDHAV